MVVAVTVLRASIAVIWVVSGIYWYDAYRGRTKMLISFVL
jgi:hypothetical protein